MSQRHHLHDVWILRRECLKAAEDLSDPAQYIRRLSRRKTEAADENPSDELLQDLHDETDLKNPYFTYVV